MSAIRDAARNAYLRVRGQRVDVQEQSALEVPASNPGPLHVLTGHTRVVSSLVFVPSTDLVVSGSYDGSRRVWSANKGREVGAQMKNWAQVRAVAVSVDKETVAHGGDDGRIVVCNLDTRQKIIEWNTGYGRIWSLSFSSYGRLASGHEDGNVVVWNASTGPVGPFKLHDDVRSVAFSSPGDRIATGGADGRLRVVYSHSGDDVIPAIQAHSGRVVSVVWSPNGQQIISASSDCTIKFWNSSDGSLLATCQGHTDYVYSIAISSDGEVLASASRDKTVRLWSTATHQQIGPHLQHPYHLYSVAISSDGHYLAAGGYDENVYIWNLADIRLEAAKLVASGTNNSTLDQQQQDPATNSETPKPSSEGNDASKKTDADANKVVPEAPKQPQSETTNADNNAEPNWLDVSSHLIVTRSKQLTFDAATCSTGCVG
ncbi:hypothetical protein HYDPIDRAFT_34249 [Hydnomerulius pinastri MD-312]|uniref:WD40 repeat-like protein n=1 Tax=Hydnomerulius pinastri MD-312 TaxID=994086 RepID=A0A0C9VYA9_9AGAM|nr:hypothetical protein HYDPIDRAFT_34249 [Hydnomerulius pinastri MD-312]